MIFVRTGPLVRLIIVTLAIAVSISLARTNANIALIWLPNAAAIFLCIDQPRAHDWQYALGFFSANVLVNLAFGDGLAFSASISLANQVETWTVVALLRRWTASGPALTFVLRLYRTFAALMIGPALSSPIGVLLQYEYFGVPYLSGFVHWFIADFTSMVVVGGFFIYRRIFAGRTMPEARPGWLEVPALLLVMAGLYGFQVYLESTLYLVAIVPMFWAALRLPNQAGSALIAIVAIATLLMLPGFFGFSDTATQAQQFAVLQAQIIIGIFALTANIAHQLNCFNVSAIADLASANRALEQSRAFARLAEEASQLGHWQVDRRTQTVFWSDMVHKIHGTDPASFQPTLSTGIGFYLEEDRPMVAKAIADALAMGQPFEFVARIRRRDGAIRTLQVLGHVDGTGGDITSIFGVLQDLTDRKREEELQQANAELERFSYACSHDLSEPTRLLSVLTDMLIEDEGPSPDPHRADLLRSINRNARRLNELVGNLLTFSRLGTEPERAEVDLSAVAAEVSDALSLMVAEKQARIVATGLGTGMGAQTHFRQMFQNLVSNALRHGRYDGPPEITIRRIDEPGTLHLVVADNGLAPSPAAIEAIRSALTPDQARAPRGRGLGLWITASIVRRYGGEIWHQAASPTGTEIHIRLPDAAGEMAA